MKIEESDMRDINSLIGMQLGRLIIIGEGEPRLQNNGYKRRTIRCQCTCVDRTIIDVIESDLFRREDRNRKPTRSCGCLWRESLQTLPQLFKHTPNKWSEKLTDEHGDYYIGWTNNTNAEFYVDARDFNLVRDYCWRESVDHSGYHRLETSIDGKNCRITRLLNCVGQDHIDRNPLNNRRYNLRPVTPSENCINRSKFKNNKSGVTGVYWDEQRRRWIANIRKDNIPVYLGSFTDLGDAVKVRLEAELQYFGPEFAPQRHLFEEYGIDTTQQND